ncbi:hypothetical protein SVAN01_04482 [Stagonosporopsis vannaccii]|nr:hypothetical protein SVAN01_04482 [Stagonosporopsis vannaccii]
MSAVSSVVSSVVSSAIASATPTGASCASADFTRFPTTDVACAVGSTTATLPSNASSVLEQCCKSAPVESFNGDCGYYCLSVQQSVADLQGCFMENGIPPQVIFCNGTNSATATGTPTRSASSSGSSGSASGTGSPAASGSAGAAAGLVVPQVSKAGLGLLGTVIVSIFAGAML